MPRLGACGRLRDEHILECMVLVRAAGIEPAFPRDRDFKSLRGNVNLLI